MGDLTPSGAPVLQRFLEPWSELVTFLSLCPAAMGDSKGDRDCETPDRHDSVGESESATVAGLTRPDGPGVTAADQKIL